MRRWLYVCFLFYVVLSVADAQVRTESSGDSILKVDIDGDEVFKCTDSIIASLLLKSDCYSPNGYVWTVDPPQGLSVGQTGDSFVYYPGASTLGTYTVRAQSADVYSCFDTCIVHIVETHSIDASSPESGSSANPPPFEGHTPWPFDVTHSPDPDKHMVVFYKDVVDSSFNVQDFDVMLNANVLPTSITANQLSEVWSKISGPNSGDFDRTDTFEVKYQNPKQGGVYRFDFDLGISGCTKSEANVVLPLAGAEMDGVMQSDLPIANAFAAAVKARYNPNELQKFNNWRRWFWVNYAGDYIGRPDNANTPTVWVCNQVNDVTGFGVVCTWKGRPVRLTKLSNFILGYAMQKIGASRAKARRGTGLYTITETTDRASVGAGWDVANGGNYDTTVSSLVDYIWTHEADNDKSRKLWPNPNAPDNYRGSSTFTPFDFNTGYGAPGFLFMTR